MSKIPNYRLNKLLFFVLQKAEISIRFYKNIRKTDAHQLETLEQELGKIKHAAVDCGINAIEMNPLKWADFKTQHARKALTIGISLVVLNTCSGVTFMKSRSIIALHRGPLYFTEIEGSLTMATVAVLGASAATQLVDRIGRKVNKVQQNCVHSLFKNESSIKFTKL